MDKTTIHMVPEPRKTELVNACYPIIGAIFEVDRYAIVARPKVRNNGL